MPFVKLGPALNDTLASAVMDPIRMSPDRPGAPENVVEGEADVPELVFWPSSGVAVSALAISTM